VHSRAPRPAAPRRRFLPVANILRRESTSCGYIVTYGAPRTRSAVRRVVSPAFSWAPWPNDRWFLVSGRTVFHKLSTPVPALPGPFLAHKQGSPIKSVNSSAGNIKPTRRLRRLSYKFVELGRRAWPAFAKVTGQLSVENPLMAQPERTASERIAAEARSAFRRGLPGGRTEEALDCLITAHCGKPVEPSLGANRPSIGQPDRDLALTGAIGPQARITPAEAMQKTKFA